MNARLKTRLATIRKMILFTILSVLLLPYIFPGIGFIFRFDLPNYERIRRGMTYAQVCWIMGPPRDEVQFEFGPRLVRWEADMIVGVYFEDGRVYKVIRGNSVLIDYEDPDSKFTQFLRSWGILPRRVMD